MMIWAIRERRFGSSEVEEAESPWQCQQSCELASLVTGFLGVVRESCNKHFISRLMELTETLVSHYNLTSLGCFSDGCHSSSIVIATTHTHAMSSIAIKIDSRGTKQPEETSERERERKKFHVAFSAVVEDRFNKQR